MTTPDDDLIERVARAIYEAHPWGDEDHEQGTYAWETLVEIWQDAYRAGARAAIGAMREPTEAMLAAALPLTTIEVDRASMLLCEKALALLEPQGFPARHHADGINAAQRIVADWRRMIDAALNPAPAKPDGDA